MFQRIVFCFLVSTMVLGYGCSSGGNEEKPFRLALKPASKKAPDFSKEPLITEDNTGTTVHIDVDWDAMEKEPAEKVISKAWAALGARAFEDAIKLADICIRRFEDTARKQQASLGGKFPKAGQEGIYKELNAVGAAYYVKAESYQKMGDCEKARQYYKETIHKFPLAQNWDPRGWYWSIKEESLTKLKALEEECGNESK